MKYIGVVDGKDVSEQIGRINIHLQLGDLYDLKSEPFSINIEIPRDSLRHLVQLAATATVSLIGGGQRVGLLISIDSSAEHTTTDVAKFVSELSDRSEEIHTLNKEIFFELLTPETLAYLGPSYEPLSG